MRNSFLPTIICFCICFILFYFTCPAQNYVKKADESELIPYRENNKWGYRDLANKVVIQPTFDSVSSFREGVAVVLLNSNYYIVNTSGELIRELKNLKKSAANSFLPARRKDNFKTVDNPPAYRVQSPTNCFPNFDFEEGDFRNWETNTGITEDENQKNFIYQDGPWKMGINNSGPPNRHQLIDRQNNPGELDYYGGFPVNHPRGGRYSLKLGSNEDDIASNLVWPNRKTESVRYQIDVPNKDFSILLSYAVVFEYPQNGSLYCSSTHCHYEQPRFKASIYKPNGDTLQCFNFSFIASDPLPGFKTSPISGNIGSEVRYRDWTDVFINLSKFKGESVYLEITTADCTLGGHWGYGYFDVIECDYKIKLQNSCRTPKKTLLYGPDGPFRAYKWLDQNNNVLSNNKIDSTNVLPVNSKIRLVLDPFDGYGCKDTIEAVVTDPVPPLFDLGPAQPNCGNAGVIIGLPDNSFYSYKWTPATSLSSTSASQVTANPTSPTRYKLTVTDNLTGCVAVDSIDIKVERALVVRVNDEVTCANKPVNLTASGADTYSWSPSTGLNSTTGRTVSASPIITTVYTVTGKSNATGCEAKNQANVTINPAFQINASPVNPTDCNAVEGAIIVTNLEPNKNYLINYTRNGILFPNNSFNSDASGRIEIKNLPTGLYSNFFAELNGCGSNVLDPIRLVGPDIPKKPSLPQDQFTFCAGDTTPAIQFISTDNSIIEWTNSNNAVGLADRGTGIITPFVAANDTIVPIESYIVVKANLNGCPGPADTMKIMVNPAPRIRVNDDEICIGDTARLTASGADIYSWSPSPDIISNTGAGITSNPSTQTTYTVRGIFSSTGCGASANSRVIVYPLPTGNLLTTGTQYVCANDLITFQVASDQPNNTFQWLLNGKIIPGANGTSLTTNRGGLHTVQLTSDFGCKSLASGSVDLIQQIRPVADFGVPFGCVNTPMSFKNYSDTSLSGSMRWEWEFGDGTGSTSENPMKTYNASGTYQVTLRAFSLTCPGLNDIFKNSVVVQSPLPGIRYNTVEGLINTDIPLKARNIGVDYLWIPSTGLNNPGIKDPVFRYDSDKEYLVRISTSNGCKTVDTILVRVHNTADVFVPEIFSPNNDGINDFLEVFALGARKIHFWVFNRWGQLMFETTNPSQRWDGNFRGNPQPLENYVWIVEIETFTGQKIRKRGQTILIR